LQTLDNDIEAVFPYVKLNSSNLGVKNMPDFALYKASETLYKEYLETQKRILQNQVESQAGRYISSEFKLNELKKYGELLTKYPVLIQYLTIENKIAEKQEKGGEE